MDEDGIYKRIGELVVCFQFVEIKLREIGQYILDPARKVWPPQALRRESSRNLANKVAKLYEDNIHQCNLPEDYERQLRTEFRNLIRQFQELRRDRNRFIHSAYVELKAGGEVQALLRSNLNLVADPETGTESWDQEILSPTSFQKEMEIMGDLAWRFGQQHLQLIHRLPVTFDKPCESEAT
jgi:hypothetical protein